MNIHKDGVVLSSFLDIYRTVQNIQNTILIDKEIVFNCIPLT